MSKFKYVILIAIFLFNFVNAGFAAFTAQKASDLLNQFISAVKEENREVISNCWSAKSANKNGFWESMHITVGGTSSMAQFKKFLANHEPGNISISQKDDYYIVNFCWIPAGKERCNRPSLEMYYYVTEEEGKYKLINPIEAITKSWNISEGKNCIIHYKNSLTEKELKRLIDVVDSQYGNRNQTNPNDSKKLDYYIAPNPDICGKLIMMDPCNEITLHARNLIVSTRYCEFGSGFEVSK